MKQKVLFLMMLLCLVVGKANAYDWKGNTVNTTVEFYLYNVGFKAFLKNDGKWADNPDNASKWKFSGTTNGTITSGGNYIYVEKTWNGGNASVRNSSATVTIASSTTTSGAYKFQHTKTDGLGRGTRYFNVDNSSGNISAAETSGPDNDWLLITQDQVDEFNAQSESWYNQASANIENGDYYLYNVLTGEYIYADFGNNWASLIDISNATKLTLTKSGNGYSIKATVGGVSKFFNSNGQWQTNSVAWTFTDSGAGYQISSSNKYLQGASPSNVYQKKTSDKGFDIRGTYWILISEEQFKEDMNLSISIPANGYTTYSNNSSAINFTNSGLTVYYASSVTSDLITFTKIEDNIIPKGEGVLIKGSAGNHNVAVSASAKTLTDNNLKAGDGKAHNGSYALASKKDGSELGFYQLNSSVTIPYGKAYLDTAGATLSVKSFILSESDFDDEITAIRVVSEDVKDDNAPVYSITGVKVGKNYKGLVIKNGKTYLQK